MQHTHDEQAQPSRSCRAVLHALTSQQDLRQTPNTRQQDIRSSLGHDTPSRHLASTGEPVFMDRHRGGKGVTLREGCRAGGQAAEGVAEVSSCVMHDLKQICDQRLVLLRILHLQQTKLAPRCGPIAPACHTSHASHLVTELFSKHEDS